LNYLKSSTWNTTLFSNVQNWHAVVWKRIVKRRFVPKIE
jgi:hypothetical protein